MKCVHCHETVVNGLLVYEEELGAQEDREFTGIVFCDRECLANFDPPESFKDRS